MAETPRGVAAGRKSGFLERVLSSPGRFAGICVIGALPYLSGCIGSMMGNTSMMAAQSTSNPLERLGHMNNASFFYAADAREAERQAQLRRNWEERQRQQEEEGQRKIRDMLFACEGYHDANKDGVNPDEFYGRKDVFRKGEDIMLVVYEHPGGKIGVYIETNDGEHGVEREKPVNQFLSWKIPFNLSPGVYRILCKHGGKVAAERSIKILK